MSDVAITFAGWWRELPASDKWTEDGRAIGVAKPRPDKQEVARLIDMWLQRSRLLQLAVAQRIGISPDEFYHGYKNVVRPLRRDPDLALNIVRVFAEQPMHARATAVETLQFLILTQLPLNRFAEVQQLFPPTEWQQAIADLLPDQEEARRLIGAVTAGQAEQARSVGGGGAYYAPSLVISLSTDPDNTWSRIYLTEQTTYLGREDKQEAGANVICFERRNVSRQHALIVTEEGQYVLKNWQARNGVGIYEQRLEPGESHVLRHCDVFRIPDQPDHYRILFLLSDRETHVLPLHVAHGAQKVLVFGRALELTAPEYDLVAYLYYAQGRICSYAELSASLWPDDGASEAEQRTNLETMLTSIRRRIAEASGGFTFMQTIGRIGIRLVM